MYLSLFIIIIILLKRYIRRSVNLSLSALIILALNILAIPIAPFFLK